MTLPVQSKLILDKLTESNDKKLIVKVPLRKLKGEKGDQGETGPQGIQGETGPQGIQGVPGVDGVSVGAINVAIRSVNSLALTPFTVGTITIPYNATITGWDITSDVSGSCVVDFKVGSYSNFPTNSDLFSSNKPNLNSSQKNTIGGLNIAVSAGQLITCLLLSVAGNLKRIDVTLKITKS
jgi:hypothetical protein